jgi:hypothetical protein
MVGFTEGALQLPPKLWSEIAQLAEDLDGRSVLPVIGAGASAGCGVPLAAQLSAQLYERIRRKDIHLRDRPIALNRERYNLGRIADAVCLEHEADQLLRWVGLDDDGQWPDADSVPWHECSYQPLARMAREGMVEEAVNFNYDCHHEFGLSQEGFSLSRPHSLRGRLWPTLFTVVSDAESNAALTRRGEFLLAKVHGAADKWRRDRKSASPDEYAEFASRIIIRWRQLLDWRTDHWARDLFADRARRHILLLVGFGAEDPVTHAALTQIMEEVHQKQSPTIPRVRVIDLEPRKLPLKMLIKAGYGSSPPRPTA